MKIKIKRIFYHTVLRRFTTEYHTGPFPDRALIFLYPIRWSHLPIMKTLDDLTPLTRSLDPSISQGGLGYG
jgi:hypothetical protein